MAVVATSPLAAVEGNCRRSVLTGVAGGGHLHLCFVLDTQDSAERRRHPAFDQPSGVAAAIRWISEDYIVRNGCQTLGERECRPAMDLRQIAGPQSGNVFFERAQTLRIFLHEISRACPT